MKNNEKINYLQNNHWTEWVETRQEIENNFSDRQTIFCICGKLASGLHENTCAKFLNMVNITTIAKLAHLLP